MPASLLTPLQQQVLEAFFRREQRFFLSGGGALAGFHLAHRRTHDLDLFATADVIEDGEQALGAANGLRKRATGDTECKSSDRE